MKRLNGVLVEVLLPLAVFYGLRAVGVNQVLALLAGAVIPAVNAVRDITRMQRISGVRWFVLGVMATTVVSSLISGSPRVLLLRSAVMMAAFGLFLLASLWTKRPFLHAAAMSVLDEDKRRTWNRNWDTHPEFRRLLWLCSALWTAACLVDATLRVLIALTMPVDSVPALDAVLLVITLLVLVAIQRVFGRAYLRRRGLRLDGVTLKPLAQPLV